MNLKLIIAGKKEGFMFKDAKIVRYDGEATKVVLALRAEGYTQFMFTEQIGYEYTLVSGETIRGGKE